MRLELRQQLLFLDRRWLRVREIVFWLIASPLLLLLLVFLQILLYLHLQELDLLLNLHRVGQVDRISYDISKINGRWLQRSSRRRRRRSR